MEEKRTAELLSDFDDYKIDDGGAPEAASLERAARKTKKLR